MPTVQSYYPSFTLAIRDADGFVDPLPNETLEIKLASDNTTIETVESDGSGFVEGGLLSSIESETLVYFEHATYPNTKHVITAQSANAAYNLNPFLTFFVEDLFTTTIEPDYVEWWMKDGDLEPRMIGTSAPDTEFKYPFESFHEKDLDFFIVPVVEGMTQNVTRIDEMPTASANLSSFGGAGETRTNEVLFDFNEDAPDGGLITDLYTSPIAADTFAQDKDKIRFYFSLSFEANADTKVLYLVFAETEIFFSGDITQNGGAAEIEGVIMRTAIGTVRTSVRIVFDSAMPPQFNEIASLNFATVNDLILRGSSDTSGDITARFGYVEFVPAATVEEEVGDIYEGLVSSGDTYEGLVSSSDIYEGVI